MDYKKAKEFMNYYINYEKINIYIKFKANECLYSIYHDVDKIRNEEVLAIIIISSKLLDDYNNCLTVGYISDFYGTKETGTIIIDEDMLRHYERHLINICNKIDLLKVISLLEFYSDTWTTPYLLELCCELDIYDVYDSNIQTYVMNDTLTWYVDM